MSRSSRPRPLARRTAAAALMVLGLGILTACSDDDGGDDTSTATESSAPTGASETATGAPGGGTTQSEGQPLPASTLEVAAVDFDFELPSTEIAAGDYTIEVINEGSGSHDLVVERDGEDVAGTDSIGPGEATTLTVSLDPGEYVFYCSVGNHRSMGMEVTVTVT